jgi:GDPmannose 4,6-dehydratase
VDKKAVIFGASGQDGHYLAALLTKCGYTVVPVSRKQGFVNADITSYDAVADLIKNYKPDYIFHLAAQSTVSHNAMFENHDVISGGTLNVLEAVRLFSPQSKVFITGSGLQFKNDSRPICETDAFEARDAYSFSRIQSVYASRYFRSAFGLSVYVGYLFNHDSPLRTEQHMAKKIAEFAKRVKKDIPSQLEIGSLEAVKEYTFAGDVANAIWLLVNQENHYEAVIGSGLGYSISGWLDACFSVVGKDWRAHITIKEGYVANYKQLVSQPGLIKSMGWVPEVNFIQLAQMMMQE